MKCEKCGKETEEFTPKQTCDVCEGKLCFGCCKELADLREEALGDNEI